MKNIAVAILNWNGKKLLERFLPKVLAHSSSEATIYVIDNASKDDSVAWLSENYPQVKQIHNANNAGYAGGYNQAIPHIAEDIIILLNSDIETTPNWLTPIASLFAQNPNLAACQPKIRDLKAPENFEYAGAAGGFIDWLCYPFCRGRILYEVEKDAGQYNQTSSIFWATGAALAVRKSHYNAVGGLDESLFAHMEEIDLCWRFHRAKYDVMYCAESTVFHLGGATLHETSPHKTYLNFRNNLIIMAKNLPDRSLWGKLYIRMVLDGVAAIKFLLGNQAPHFWQVLRAHFAFYERLPAILRARQTSGPKPRLKHLPGAFRGTLIWQYFIRGHKKYSDLPKQLFRP